MGFKFEEDSVVGDTGERKFLIKHSEYVKINEKQEYECGDFKHIKNNITVEFKTDTNDMIYRTKNFFIEIISKDIKKSPGGPFRCKNIIDYFVYYFEQQDLAFWFNTNELCKIIEEQYDIYTPTYDINKLLQNDKLYKILKGIPNNGYKTWGIPVKRTDLLGICLKVEKLVELKGKGNVIYKNFQKHYPFI